MLKLRIHLLQFIGAKEFHVIRAQKAATRIELADNRANGRFREFAPVHFQDVVPFDLLDDLVEHLRHLLLDDGQQFVLVRELLREPVQRGDRLRLVAEL